MGRRRECTPAFRAAAVQMVRTSGQSIRQVALNLGISNQSLVLWLRQFEVADATRSRRLSDRSWSSSVVGCGPSRPNGTS